MRATVGIAVAVQGGVFLADRDTQTLGTLAVGLFAVTTGALILVGLLTPLVGFLVGLISMAVAFSWFPESTPASLDSSLTAFFIMATAIGFLGPGAFSMDSYLFGRREIIIPSVVRSTKS